MGYSHARHLSPSCVFSGGCTPQRVRIPEGLLTIGAESWDAEGVDVYGSHVTDPGDPIAWRFGVEALQFELTTSGGPLGSLRVTLDCGDDRPLRSYRVDLPTEDIYAMTTERPTWGTEDKDAIEAWALDVLDVVTDSVFKAHEKGYVSNE